MNWLSWCPYFLIPISAFAQQNSPAEKQWAVLEGTVVHSATQAPLRKVRVTLESVEGEQEPVLVASTDEGGHFRFVDLRAGRYSIKVQKSGFLEGAYGSAKPAEPQSVLKVSTGDHLQGLTIQIFPAGTISGQVLDVDGDPVPATDVVLWSQKRVHGKVINSRSVETTTNESGEYHFGQLAPGTYYISSDANGLQYVKHQVSVDSNGKATRLHNLTTFYPSALSLINAQKIHIDDGVNQSGINVLVQRGLTMNVKGKFEAANVSSKYRVFASLRDGTGRGRDGGELLSNGDFEFRELSPGKYQFTVGKLETNDYQIVGRTEVNVTDQDVAEVTITPFNPAQVHVRMVMEGEEDKPFTSGLVALAPTSDNDFGAAVFQHESRNGIYTIKSIVPGKYGIWFHLDQDHYLKSVQSGEQELNPDSIEIGAGTGTDLLAIFSKNVAMLSGDVEVASEDSKISVHVLLISEERPSERSGFFSVAVDQLFHFSSVQLPPGKYLAFAAEDSDAEAWNDPEFLKLLRSEGTKVELQEKEQKTIRLSLLKKTKTEQARKQLGIE